MHKSQILGHVIRRLRQMAADDAAPGDVLDFLSSRCLDDMYLPFNYLREAFLQGSLFLYTAPSDAFDEKSDRSWRGAFQQHRDQWQPRPFPELMRLRDYFSFMQIAKQEQVVVTVCGANPASGRWIGRSGVRCYDGRLPIPSRAAAPNEGLLFADPNDSRLVDLLRRFDPPLAYVAYVERLAQQGLRILGAESGYLVEDELGNRLHDGYRLHGVHEARGLESAWTHKTGERLRRIINQHLGSELVRFGPHDQWELRNDRQLAGPAWGPQLPVIEFGPDQEIRNLLSVADLASQPQYEARWADLYPHHPAKES